LTETINWNEQIQKLVLKSVSWLVDEVYYTSFLLQFKTSDLYPLILIKSEKITILIIHMTHFWHSKCWPTL
jgi:hypothetical protein